MATIVVFLGEIQRILKFHEGAVLTPALTADKVNGTVGAVAQRDVSGSSQNVVPFVSIRLFWSSQRTGGRYGHPSWGAATSSNEEREASVGPAAGWGEPAG